MRRIRLSLCAALFAQFCFGPCANCSVEQTAQTEQTEQTTNNINIGRYNSITKQLLTSSIVLERFSLKYRLENAKQPKFRRLRYFVAQETGSAGGLAFETISLKQFDIGKSHPLRISQNMLHGGLATALATGIVASAGSGFELSSNLRRSMVLKKEGYDTKSSRKFVSSRLREIDKLLVEREGIITSLPADDARERAVIETKILHELRNAFASEFTEFQSDLCGYHTKQNSFYFLNASYNAIGATSAGYGYRALTRPWLNGTTNILFIVSGAMAGVTPGVTAAFGAAARYRTKASLRKEFGINENFNPTSLSADCAALQKLITASGDHLIPSLPATQRLAIYSTSGELFEKQLANETRISRKLSQVALQTTELGTPIGGLLMTQGLLGTVANYNLKTRPLKQLALNCDGAILGTVGTSAAVVGNAASLVANWSYEHKLKKKNELPSELIMQRLSHLDDLEKQLKQFD